MHCFVAGILTGCVADVGVNLECIVTDLNKHTLVKYDTTDNMTWYGKMNMVRHIR